MAASSLRTLSSGSCRRVRVWCRVSAVCLLTCSARRVCVSQDTPLRRRLPIEGGTPSERGGSVAPSALQYPPRLSAPSTASTLSTPRSAESVHRGRPRVLDLVLGRLVAWSCVLENDAMSCVSPTWHFAFFAPVSHVSLNKSPSFLLILLLLARWRQRTTAQC